MSEQSLTQPVSRPEYGDAKYNFGCAYHLKLKFRIGEETNGFDHQQSLEEIQAHSESMEMLLSKVARIATGARKADNYDDIIGYATLAKKLAGFGDKPVISMPPTRHSPSSI